MNSFGAQAIAECLTIESHLSELSRVPAWIERLASLHALPDRTRYAMDLCLEEVLSNIIRHGYKGNADGIIRISCLARRDGSATLVVDDEAPPFNPLAFQSPPDLNSLEFISLGGQGIHLLKEFADALDYEPRPTGNRLTISFNSPGLSPAPI